MEISIALEGTTALIPQSDRLANPLDPMTREYKGLTSKRKKTEDDLRDIFELEWKAALYYDPELGPIIPAINIWASFRDGGKLSKLGTAVERAVYMQPDPSPILYNGPRDLDELWKDERFQFLKSVVVQRQRTPRMRPIFQSWAVHSSATLLSDVLDFDALQRVADQAGQLIGLGTYRRGGYGRFSAVLKELR